MSLCLIISFFYFISQIRGDDDEGDEVTYSTVRASSSSAGASTDLSNLYATVNKPKK